MNLVCRVLDALGECFLCYMLEQVAIDGVGNGLIGFSKDVAQTLVGRSKGLSLG